MTTAKKRLAILWFVAGPLLLIFVVFSIKEENALIPASWVLTNIIPVLSLIAGVLVVDLLKPEEGKTVDKFLFYFAFYVSLLFLLLISLLYFSASIRQSDLDPKQLVLAFNGLLNLTLGVFYIKGERSKSISE